MNGIQFHLRFSSSYTTLASLANRLFFSSSMPTHLLFPWTICYRFELRILKTDNIYSNILNFILFLCVRRACRSYRKLSSLYRPKSGWIKRSALFFSSGIEKKTNLVCSAIETYWLHHTAYPCTIQNRQHLCIYAKTAATYQIRKRNVRFHSIHRQTNRKKTNNQIHKLIPCIDLHAILHAILIHGMKSDGWIAFKILNGKQMQLYVPCFGIHHIIILHWKINNNFIILS